MTEPQIAIIIHVGQVMRRVSYVQGCVEWIFEFGAEIVHTVAKRQGLDASLDAMHMHLSG